MELKDEITNKLQSRCTWGHGKGDGFYEKMTYMSRNHRHRGGSETSPEWKNYTGGTDGIY